MADRNGRRQERESARPSISLVVPVFDEEEVLPELLDRVHPILARLFPDRSEVLLVDDGSTDRSRELIRHLAEAHANVRGVFLSRNFGQQAAISAGLAASTGDVVAVLDADLQDPPELLEEMLERWREGADVAYAVRSTRKGPLWKRAAYRIFYRVMDRLSDVPMALDSGDFALLDRKVVDVLVDLPERRRFLRGLRAWVGFRQVSVPYERPERAGGDPGYSVAKLFALALDGLFGFSYWPILGATLLGVGFATVAFFLSAWAVVARFTAGYVPPGWASVTVLVTFIGGVQLLALGIIGEYIRRIYDEVRRRPAYVVDEVVGGAE